jgi:hypothetical protein
MNKRQTTSIGVILISGTMLAWFYHSPSVNATSHTFSAGVIAEQATGDSHVAVLGEYQYCRLASAEKQDPLNSACYIYKNAQQLWVVESINAHCQAACE